MFAQCQGARRQVPANLAQIVTDKDPLSKGVWHQTTDNNYAFRIKAFNFNAQNVFTGWSIISGELTVDQTGDAFTGSGGTVQVYEPNGVLVANFCADSVGTRFEL